MDYKKVKTLKKKLAELSNELRTLYDAVSSEMDSYERGTFGYKDMSYKREHIYNASMYVGKAAHDLCGIVERKEESR